MKIAFLFLTYDCLNRSDLWKIFFESIDEDLYNIYIHNKFEFTDPYFKKYLILLKIQYQPNMQILSRSELS